MAAKELKLLVKAARTALDKQDYQEAIKQCEVRMTSLYHIYLVYWIGCVLGQ